MATTLPGRLTLRYQFGDHVIEYASKCEPTWGEIHRKAARLADTVSLQVDPEGGHVMSQYGPHLNPEWNEQPIRQRDPGDETGA